MELVSLIVAIIALIVSGLSAAYSLRQAKAAERAVDIESERHHHELQDRAAADTLATTARLTVDFAPREQNSSAQIVFENTGAADATEVSMTFREVLDGKSNPQFQRWTVPSAIRAGESKRMSAFLLSNSSQHFSVKLQWRDASGRHSEVIEVGPR